MRFYPNRILFQLDIFEVFPIQRKVRYLKRDSFFRLFIKISRSIISTARTAGATVARSTPDRKVIRSNRVWFNTSITSLLLFGHVEEYAYIYI
jgi:hypothetical protein